MSGKNISKLSDAVWISRILSAVANSSDENGILTGRWDGQYDDGKSPVSWNGSVEIIQKYAQTNTPVKYGQCWVFSGKDIISYSIGGYPPLRHPSLRLKAPFKLLQSVISTRHFDKKKTRKRPATSLKMKQFSVREKKVELSYKELFCRKDGMPKRRVKVTGWRRSDVFVSK